MGGGAGGDDGQRERQPRAPLDDVGDRVRIGRHAVPAEPAFEQPVGLRGGEQVDGERVGAVRGHQIGQRVATGDDDHAAG
jgi:hypothetical protein